MNAERDRDTNSPPLSDTEIAAITRRCSSGTSGVWDSYVQGRDHSSGNSFIQTGSEDLSLAGAPVPDQDFVAYARQDIPRLLAHIERLKRLMQSTASESGLGRDERPAGPRGEGAGKSESKAQAVHRAEAGDGGSNLDDEDLAAIKRRYDETTPGEWVLCAEPSHRPPQDGYVIRAGGMEFDLYGTTAADRDFMVHARPDTQKLLDEVERLKQLLGSGDGNEQGARSG